MKIDIREITEEGLEITGESPSGVFELEEKGVQPLSGIRYSLHVLPAHGGEPVATGKLSADFSLTCVRCLEKFPYRVEIEHFATEISTKNGALFDLTDLAREDIILDLPGYPHCETSNLTQRQCPAEKLFEGRSAPGSSTDDSEKAPTRSEVWDVLNDLKPPDET